MVFGVITYQRSAAENRQAAALGMLQNYLKLAVEHPDLASRGPSSPPTPGMAGSRRTRCSRPRHSGISLAMTCDGNGPSMRFCASTTGTWRRAVSPVVTLAVRTAIVFVLAVVSSAPAWAQQTDVVTLANGDRNTGEIVELDRGRLKFETDDAGTILFEWDKIATVEAAGQFEVTTSDGRRFLGSLGRSSARSVLIITASDTITLSMSEVTGIHRDRCECVDETRRIHRCRLHVYALERDRAVQSELRNRVPPARVPASADDVGHPD